MSFLNLHTILGWPLGESYFLSMPTQAYKVENLPRREKDGRILPAFFLPQKQVTHQRSACQVRLRLHPLQPSLCGIPICLGRASLLQAAVEVFHFLCSHYWYLSWVDYLCSLRWVGTKVLPWTKSGQKPDCGCT